MPIPVLRRLLLAWMAFFALTILLAPAHASSTHAGALVDVPWLRAHQAQVLLLDASFTHQHRAGHIPGSASADLYRHGSEEPDAATMAERIRGWGVSAGRTVVIYDQGGDWPAARLFHDLVVHGVPPAQLRLLDGGLARWKALGGAVATGASPEPKPGTWPGAPRRNEERVLLPEFLAATGSPATHVVVDALGPDYHFGQRRFFNRAGHVPGSVLLPSDDFFNADKTWKSPDDIRRLLRYHGIRAEHTVLSHCGGGGAAAVPWFALRQLVGHAAPVKMYLGSQREWLRDDRQLPFDSYALPRLQRPVAYVAAWNAPMLRAFGASQLNLIDVRSAEAHGRGHVAFAVSVPAADWRTALATPAATTALAERLGAAGINPLHEVVLLGEGGLTPDTALAFLALEQLGHRRVGWMSDSHEEWQLRGEELTREPTRAGMPRGMGDTALPPQRWVPPPAAPAALMRGAPHADEGVFPSVAVALGGTPSSSSLAALPAGTRWLALPRSELVAADGQPLPAAELWSRIHKAGVPRHARLLLVADDVADAALGYAVFRLMGWPDVKVWLP
jgi:thiosulfate/3-mercaptopyruvate sulfurtransferase